MKKVNLITLKSKPIMVDDLRGCVEMHKHETQLRVIANSQEYIPSFVDVESCEIQLIVEQGVKHYLAVSRDVWEYLYVMENPVTAMSQKNLIVDLQDYKSAARVTIELDRIKIKAIKEMGLWARIKWVFTGVKV